MFYIDRAEPAQAAQAAQAVRIQLFAVIIEKREVRRGDGRTGYWELRLVTSLPSTVSSHTFTVQKPDIKSCSVCLHCTAPLMDAMI